MTEEWRRIESFPNYAVSDTGIVRNDETGQTMAMLVNQSGVVNVGLTKNKVQYKRSVALLVALAFIKTARSLEFNTPINLDGDRFNNGVPNLLWRPRWFAVQYAQQFKTGPIGFDVPIEDMASKQQYKTSFEAATIHGLLEVDIVLAVTSKTWVWPTYQKFVLL
jgi:hypothetical protein